MAAVKFSRGLARITRRGNQVSLATPMGVKFTMPADEFSHIIAIVESGEEVPVDGDDPTVVMQCAKGLKFSFAGGGNASMTYSELDSVRELLGAAS